MKSGGGTLLTLAGFFALMSLFAIGGANSAVPEIHRFAVNVQNWLSDRQFSESFALAQLTPGPNVILVTLIGYHVAGILGGVVATFAMCGPTSVLAFFVGTASDRFRGSRWHIAFSRGLIPVTLGLTASRVAIAITAGTAVTAYFARVHPLWAFAAAALLGLIGLV
jgi:chromate transporter